MDPGSMLQISSDIALERRPNEFVDEPGTLRKDEIRLIRLLPNRAANTIRCETAVASLSSNPTYIALSYTWGAPPDSHAIEIDGQEVHIRKNLWRFFHRFNRLHVDCSAFVWVDSLCIDQNNTVEKTRQISQMGRIFYQARKVVVWLGPAYSDSDVAMEAIANYAALYQNARKQAKFWSEASGIAVIRLSQRAYWTRLWVLQELILAQRIILLCGQRQVDWSAFLNLMTAMSRMPQSRNNERNTDYQAIVRSPAMSLIEQSMRPLDYTLWELMFANRTLKCSEPRDRVFALLGVAAVQDLATIVPNYKVPLCHLMNDVLWMHHQEHPPTSIEAVAHECGLLTALFGLDSASIFDLTDADGVVHRAVVKDVSSCPLGNPSIMGITPWWAVFYGHEAVERLLSRRDDIRGVLRGVIRGAVRESSLGQYDDPGEGTLEVAWEWAVGAGEADAVRVLLRSGRIDPSEEQFDGRDALQEAIYHQHEEVILVLAQEGNRYSSCRNWLNNGLHVAARASYNAAVELLLENGADIDSDNGLALLLASAEANVAVVRTLLERGAGVNCQQEIDGTAALHVACVREMSGGREAVIWMLLEHGADPDIPGGPYGSAIVAAWHYKSTSILRLLLEYGADVDHLGVEVVQLLERASERDALRQGRKFAGPNESMFRPGKHPDTRLRANST
ncbi:hypothetical protein LTR56_015812 [Elasticomyces elasticus]|nr:hypothetical protein LTR56_015812 [Elasticomyces elasticus]KAK3644096.1 hypothetical protein LTR22_015418 [Elasticomyces elasticus]KAK4922019.1 hypothetical protein LTR49_010604 [Elasticomyces elasticus]KAK5768800.1 hypothetical protein LTS12_000860 [Elasticomyces elasticus]